MATQRPPDAEDAADVDQNEDGSAPETLAESNQTTVGQEAGLENEPTLPKALPIEHPNHPGHDFIAQNGFDPTQFAPGPVRDAYAPVITQIYADNRQLANQRAQEAKVQKKQANDAREAYYRTHGIKSYVDAEGNQMPVLDENGKPVYHAKTGPIQYDQQTGEAFRINRDATGQRSQVNLDAGAPIGPADDDPNNLYKQNKYSAWQNLGPIEDHLGSDNPRLATAAQAAQTARNGLLQKAATQGFKVSEDKIANDAREAEVNYAQVQKQQQQLQAQIDGKKADPQYNTRHWWGAQTDESAKLQADVADLEGKKAALPPPPDLKAFKAKMGLVPNQKKAFDFLVEKHGGDVLAAEQDFRDQIQRAGGDPDTDPAMQHLDAYKKSIGMPTLQEARNSVPEQVEQVLRLHPEYAKAYSDLNAAMESYTRIAQGMSQLNAATYGPGSMIGWAQLTQRIDNTMEQQRQAAAAKVQEAQKRADEARDKAIADQAGLQEKSWNAAKAAVRTIGGSLGHAIKSIFDQDPSAQYSSWDDSQLAARQQQLQAQLRELEKQGRFSGGWTDAGDGEGGSYSRGDDQANALDKELQNITFARNIKYGVTDPEMWKQALSAGQMHENYSTNPALENTALTKSGRILGGIAGFTAEGAIQPLVPLAIMVGSASSEARDAAEEQMKASGETDPAKIRLAGDAAERRGAAFAAGTIPIFMLGGKFASEATKRLLPYASPLVRAATGFTLSGASNMTASAVTRKLEGGDFLPTPEEAAQDWAWALLHGHGEFKGTRQSRAVLDGTNKQAAQLALLATDDATPPELRAQAWKALDAMQEHAAEFLTTDKERKAAQAQLTTRRVIRANEAIDDLDESHPLLAGASPAQIESTKNLMRGLVKVGSGQPLDALTAEEQQAINAPTADGVPRVDQVKGKLVISQPQIDRLRSLVPEAADVIRSSEQEYRNSILNPKPPVQPPKAEVPKQSPQQAVAGEGAAGPGGTSAPLAGLQPEHAKRAKLLAQHLQNAGASPGDAEHFAASFVQKHGLENYHQQRVAIVGAWKARTPSAEAKQHITHAQVAEQVYQEAVKNITARGEKISDQQHERLRQAAAIFAPAIARHRAAFDQINYHLENTDQGSGGAFSTGAGKLSLSVGDILDEFNQAEFKENPKRPGAIVREEAIHSLMRRFISDHEVEGIWNLLPDHVKALVREAYLDFSGYEKAKKPRSQHPEFNNGVMLGHEYLRMLTDGKLDKTLSEMSSPSLLKTLKAFFERLLTHFTNLRKDLADSGVPEDTIKLVDETTDKVAAAYRKIVADADAAVAYEEGDVTSRTTSRNPQAGGPAPAHSTGEAGRGGVGSQAAGRPLRPENGAPVSRGVEEPTRGQEQVSQPGTHRDNAGGLREGARGSGEGAAELRDVDRGAENTLAGQQLAEPAPSPRKLNETEFPTQEVPLGKITLSKDVPNFKEGADAETGVVKGNELKGDTYERLGKPPIVLWERKDGRLEVITGRHRLEKARRLGEETIPAQIVREADGFSKDQALTFDAESNIQDDQGDLKDYAHFFRNYAADAGGLTREQAEARGLLSRAKGRAGWDIGKNASDDTYALFAAGKISGDQAVAIAHTAPNNPALQRVGALRALEGYASDLVQNFMLAARAEYGTNAKALDLFGSDDAALQKATAQAKRASTIQRGLREQIAAVSGATKRPELAKKMGVNIDDPKAVQAKIDEIRGQLARWENWPLHHDLVEQTLQTAKAKTEPALFARRPGEREEEFRALLKGKSHLSGVVRAVQKMPVEVQDMLLDLAKEKPPEPSEAIKGELDPSAKEYEAQLQKVVEEFRPQYEAFREQFTPDVREAFDTALEQIAAEEGEEALSRVPLKGERAIEKAWVDNPAFPDLATIKDILRGSLVATSDEGVQRLLEQVKAKFTIHKLKDRFSSPLLGYRDYMIQVKLPSGHFAEIQIHRADMLFAKEVGIGHQIYEEVRKALAARVMMRGKDDSAVKEWQMTLGTISTEYYERAGGGTNRLSLTKSESESSSPSSEMRSGKNTRGGDTSQASASPSGSNTAGQPLTEKNRVPSGKEGTELSGRTGTSLVISTRDIREKGAVVSQKLAADQVARGGAADVPREHLAGTLRTMATMEGPIDISDKLTVGGRNLFHSGLGIDRADMPQIPSAHKERFYGQLREQGVQLENGHTIAERLHPSQGEIDGVGVGRMIDTLDVDRMAEKPILVSGDNYVVDGHHRWAAYVAKALEGKAPRGLPVTRVRLPIRDLLVRAKEYMLANGIEARDMGDHSRSDTTLPARRGVKVGPGQGGFDFLGDNPLTASEAERNETSEPHHESIRPKSQRPALRRPSARTAPSGGMDDLFSILVQQHEPSGSEGLAGGGQGELFDAHGQSHLGGAAHRTGDAAGAGRLGGGAENGELGPGRANGTGPDRRNGQPPIDENGNGNAGELGGGSRNEPGLVERPADPNARNHVIERGTEVSPRGTMTKLRANIDAIRLLKQIESEGRNATPEEKAKLVKYSGWGAISQAFDDEAADAIARGDIETRRETARRYRSYGDSPYYTEEAERQEAAIQKLERWQEKWGEHHKALKEALTPEEYKRAQRSTINAHYTSPAIISGMWDMARRLGFQGGNVLEPAAGIGHFFGLMPEDMMNRSKLHAVELDDLSGRITKLLYPEADTQITGFQNADIADGSIDLAISNVPFANVPVKDNAIAAMDGPTDNLHDYFFAKTMTKLRPGGVAMFITSSFTMDKGDSSNRRWLSQHGDLVAAYRLPNDAFRANAGTDVVTDVVILRKKDGDIFPHSELWNGTAEAQTQYGHPIRVNEYFAAHPQNILGLLADDGEMYGGGKEMTVHSDPNRPADVALQQAIDNLPKDIIGEGAGRDVRSQEAVRSVKMGSIIEKDGKYYFHGQEAPDEELNDPKNAGRVRRFMAVRDALNTQYDLELNPQATDEQVEDNRAELNRLYDNFVRQHKDLHWRANKSLFIDDPDYFRLAGAEIPEKMQGGIAGMVAALAGKQVQKFTKADVFKKRVLSPRTEPTKADTVEDAFGMSLGWRGRVDTDYMAQLLGEPRDAVERGLLEREIAVRDPESQRILSREEYLSGNVRKKLEIARAAGPDYERNVRLLEGAQPPDVPMDEIGFNVGSTWIPSEYYERFLSSIGLDGVKVEYAPATTEEGTDRWKVTARRAQTNGTDWKQYEVSGKITAPEILDSLLNFRRLQFTKTEDNKKVDDPVTTQRAKDAARAFNAAFVKWAKGHPDYGPELAKIYNHEVNGFALRNFDGQHLTFPWASKDFDIFPDKKNVVWRAIQDGFGLIAHGVGGGKTIVGSAIALELRRLNLARKPMIVVHNATLEQFADTIAKIAPTARVLVGRKDELAGAKRKEFLMRIAAGDWDAVVVAHSTFSLIEDDPEFARRHMESMVNEIWDSLREDGIHDLDTAKKAQRGDMSVKQRVKALEKLETQVAKLAERRTDTDLLNFQQLGVDALVVDEVHEFKKLPFSSKLDVKGVDNGMSQRGYAMLMRARGIQEKMGGKNIFTMTGTPVTNTLGEVWNMVRLVAPHLLREYKIESFDQFVSKFATVESRSEETASGERKMVERLARIVNLPEWATFFRSAADVKLGDALTVKNRPGIAGGGAQLTKVDRTAGAANWIEYIRKVLRGMKEMTREDYAKNPALNSVPVQAYMASRAAAIDIRLIDPSAQDEPGSKVNTMVKRAMELYRETAPYQGTQVIFSDSYNPVRTTIFDSVVPLNELQLDLDPNKGLDADFNLYEDIKKKLIAEGVPAEEVALITDKKYDGGSASASAARKRLFDDVNSGKVRFVMGSTKRLGTGVNMQQRMIAAHHLDAPWTPADLEQRDGRVYRQGNIHAEMGIPVHLIRYGMADSLDSAIWDKLWTKQRFINSALSGKFSGRELEEEETVLSLAEQQAILSGPYGAEIFEAENRIRELKTSRQGHEQGKSERASEIYRARQELKLKQESQAKTANALNYMQELGASIGENAPQIAVNGQTFETRKALTEALDAALKKAKDDALAVAAGKPKALESITVNGKPVQLVPHISTETVETEGERGEMREHERRVATFHLYPPTAKGEDSPSFGRVTSAATLFARLEELGSTARSILAGQKIDLARLRQTAEQSGVAEWAHQAELDRLEARLDELNDLEAERQRSLAGKEKKEGESQALHARRGRLQETFDTIEKNLAEDAPTMRQALHGEFDVTHPWQIHDQEGNLVESFETKQEAQQFMRGEAMRGERIVHVREAEPNPQLQLLARRGVPADDRDQLGFDFKNGNTPADRIRNNIGLVDHLSRRFSNIPSAQPDDVRSQARTALVRAAREYTPEKGDFQHYATRAIRNALIDLFRREKAHYARNHTTLNEPQPGLEGETEQRIDNVADQTQNTAQTATNHDAAQVLRDAVASLPEKPRLVAEGILAGRTLEEIGRDVLGGLTRQSAGNFAKIAFQRLRQKLMEKGITGVGDMMALSSRRGVRPSDDAEMNAYESIAALQRLAEIEKPGARTVGRPDLAMGTSHPAMMGVDEFRKGLDNQETVQDWTKDADKLLANREAVRRTMMRQGLTPGGTLRPAEAIAAKKLVANEMKRVFASNDTDARRDLALLINAYRQTGMEAARALGSRFDPTMKPEDRHREFLGKIIFTPPPEVQKAIDEAPDAATRKKLLEEDQARVTRIEKELAKMGVSLDDIMNGEVQLRLKSAKFVENTAKAFAAKEREAIRMLQANRTREDIAKHTGLTVPQIEAAEQKLLDAFLKKHLGKFEAGATLENVDLDALSSRPLHSRTVTKEEALREAMRAWKAMGFGRSEAQGKPAFDIKKPTHVVKVARVIQAAEKNKFDMAYEWWINSILAGPATHTAIFAGVSLNAAMDFTVRRGVEAFLNSALSLVGKNDPRAAQWGEFPHIFRGLVPGLVTGWRNALEAWDIESSLFEHRHNPDMIGKLGTDLAANWKVAIPGKLGRVVRVPGRAIQFLDEFFKTAFGRMQVGAEAYRLAKAEGLEGAAMENRIRDLVDNPYSEAWPAAVERGVDLMLQRPLRRLDEGGNLAEAFGKGITDFTNKYKPMKFFIPFVRIGYNILATGVRQSPLGTLPLVKNFIQQGLYHFKDGKLEPAPHTTGELIRHAAEQVIAWGALGMLWGAVQGDDDDQKKPVLITGGEAIDEKTKPEASMAKRLGLGPYSMRVGKTTFNYGRYEPIATVIGTTADIIKHIKEMEHGMPASEAIGSFLSHVAGQFSEKTYGRGLDNLIRTIQSPKNLVNWASETLASFVPNIIRQPMRNFDPFEREQSVEATGKDLPGQFMQKTGYRMLPLPSILPPKVDQYGREMAKGGSSLGRVLAPGNPHEILPMQQADQLLENWNRMHPEEAWAPATLHRTFRVGRDNHTMTNQEFHDFSQDAGRRVVAELQGKLTQHQIEHPTQEDVDQIRKAFTKGHHEAHEAFQARKGWEKKGPDRAYVPNESLY